MPDVPIRPARGEPLRCPTCGTRLVELERSEILIDACPECRGVWLDRGELDRILDRERRASAGVRDHDEDFFEEMEGRRRPGGDDRPRDPAPRDETPPKESRKRRRRGMLEDLFDFEF
ncbi:MAG: zf-TFIIB domain-containing protein [Thermoleophilia bacterium]